MVNNKSKVLAKQLVIPGTEPPGAPDQNLSVQLATAMLDIVDWLCTEDLDVEKLVNEVKPKLEAILRSS